MLFCAGRAFHAQICSASVMLDAFHDMLMRKAMPAKTTVKSDQVFLQADMATKRSTQKRCAFTGLKLGEALGLGKGSCLCYWCDHEI